MLNKLASNIIYVLSAALMGLLVIVRRSRHPIGWLLYLAGCAFGINELLTEYTVYTSFTTPGNLPGGQFVAVVLNSFWVILFTLYFWMMAIFPDGHLPSPRWRWVFGSVALLTVSLIASSLLEQPLESAFGLPNPLPVSGLQSFNNFLFVFSLVLLVVTAVGVLAVIVFRFRQVQDDERQQLKWLAGAMLFSAIAIITGLVVRFILNFAIGEQLLIFSLAFLSLGIGIAILRYRLYDIDFIIRRTLIYGALVIGLAVAYFGSVALLQFLSEVFTGPQSNLVIVVITLAIAALFNPVRRRFQDWIDRRFYREKVDFRQAFTTFAREVRTIIDLSELLQVLVTRTTDLLHITHGAVFLVGEDGTFQLVESRDLPEDIETSLPLDTDSLAHLQDGQPISSPKVETFPLLVPLIAPATQSKIQNRKS